MKSTQPTTYRILNSELNRINNSLEDLRTQAATGKKINRPSDDPAAIRPVLSARTQIRATDRFISSMSTSLDRIDNQDTYLDQVENLLVGAKEVTINALNGSLNSQDLNTLADQVGYIKTEMLSVANAQVGGQYIFSGFKEDTRPFSKNGDQVVYDGDSNVKRLETAPGEYVETNLSGANLFMGLADDNGDGILESDHLNVFDLLTNLERALRGQSGQVLDTLGNEVSLDSGAVDGGGTPILLEYDGQPVNLQPMLNTYGEQVTIAEYNAKFPASAITAYDGSPVVDDSQPLYFHSDGKIAAVDSAGQPVLSDTAGAAVLDGGGNPISLLDGGGEPMQYTEVPPLEDFSSTLETAADYNRSVRGRMGNNAQRIETSKNHMEGVQVDLQQILSRYEDADLVEVITQITQTETALEAALKVTSRVGSISILDYL